MKGRDALREMVNLGRPKEQGPEASPPRSGAVRAMDLGLQKLSSEADAAKALRATLAASEQVVELDPAIIDSSFVADRIPIVADPEYVALKAAIESHGQQVPIMVRAHPDDQRRYQVAYGHRRLRAAAELGRKVKAIVRKLSDAELVVAQGQENSERRDLSFIERSLFAAHLEERGFDRDTLVAALGVDKPELSRLLGVADAIPQSLILSIGPAPKVGRPRWLELVEALKTSKSDVGAQTIVDTDGFVQADTNERFRIVLEGLRRPKKKSEVKPSHLVTSDGRKIGRIEKLRGRTQIITSVPAFAQFLEGKIPTLVREFELEQEIEGKGGH